MRLIISLATAAAVAGLASTADAQRGTAPKQPDTRTRVSPDESCTSVGGNIECRVVRRADMDSVLMRRAALGIELSPTGTMRDTIGVFVSRVTPKGPAENAGVIEGDRLVSINGVDLRVNSADAGDSYAAGLPSRRLTREVQKLAPGARVSLRVWSGGRIRDVQVTAGRASDLRDRGSLGYFEGMPGGMMMRPGMIQSFPRMRIQGNPRIFRDGMEKLRLEGLEKLDFDEVALPLRSKLLTTEPLIIEDGEVLLPAKKKTKTKK